MQFKRINFLAFALAGVLPVVLATSTPVHAQDQSTQQDERAKERKKSSQDTRAEKRSDQKTETESKPSNATRREDVKRQNAPNQERPEAARTQSARSAQGRPQAQPNAHYHFRSQDRSKLRQHFQSQLAQVNRANRPHVVAGGQLPPNYQTYIVPVPSDVVVYLEPPPPGYEIAFFEGYVIVYDPTTGLILDVIDLLS